MSDFGHVENLAAETGIVPMFGEAMDPHLTAFQAFAKSDQTKLFVKKYCGKKTPEHWFKSWSESIHPALGCTPEEAVDRGRLAEVTLFIERAIRG